MSHPRQYSGFPAFLAHHPLWKLVLFYFLAVALVSFGFGISLYLTAPSERSVWQWWWYTYAFCNGFQPDRDFPLGPTRRTIIVAMSTVQLLFPALFLGAVVFKLLLPGRRMLIHRTTLPLARHKGRVTLEISSYLATHMRVEDLKFETHLRAYFPHSLYPLRNERIQEAANHLPLPINALPTLAGTIPIAIVDSNEDVGGNGEPLVFVRTAHGLQLVAVWGERDFDPHSVHLILQASGRIPDLDSEFNEVEVFTPEQVVDRWAVAWELGRFDPELNQIEMKNWHEFENSWSIEQHVGHAFELIAGKLPEGLEKSREAPPPRNLNSTSGSLTREEFTFEPEPGEELAAVILRPSDDGGCLPAVLCLHQSTPDKHLGMGEPLGDGGSANCHYARELAERGYLAMVVNYPGYGGYEPDVYSAGYQSVTMKAFWNHVRALDLLAARSDVDEYRLAAVGHSLGASNALFLATFDRRVRVVLASAGFTSFHDYRGGDLRGWSRRDKYMPLIGERFGDCPQRMPLDFDDLIGALAPTPLYINAPRRDEEFAFSGVERLLPSIRSHYEKHGATKSLQVETPDVSHDWPGKERRAAYEFLDQHLGHTARDALPGSDDA